MPLLQVGGIIMGTVLCTLTGVGIFQNNPKMIKACAAVGSLSLLGFSVYSVL